MHAGNVCMVLDDCEKSTTQANNVVLEKETVGKKGKVTLLFIRQINHSLPSFILDSTPLLYTLDSHFSPRAQLRLLCQQVLDTHSCPSLPRVTFSLRKQLQLFPPPSLLN